MDASTNNNAATIPTEKPNEQPKQNRFRRILNRMLGKKDSKTGGKKSSGIHGIFSCTQLRASNQSHADDENVRDKSFRVKRKKNEKVKGRVLFDQTTNADVWNQIVKDSILGPGLVLKAAICNRETFGIYAYAPIDFTPSVEQLEVVNGLIRAEDGDTQIVNPNFTVALEECVYRGVDEDKLLRAEVRNSSLIDPQQQQQQSQSGELDGYEIGVAVTSRSILIGLYRSNERAPEARRIMYAMRDYLQEQNM